MALGLAAQLGHGGDDQHKELITHTLADGLHDDPYSDEPTECPHARSARLHA
jgi:hypothetical protein